MLISKIGKKIISIALLTGFLLLIFYFSAIERNPKDDKTIRIGYFDGGRLHPLYRAYINGYFDAQGLDVEFYTKSTQPGLIKIPKDHLLFKQLKNSIPKLGRMTGLEIAKEIKNGNLDGGGIGEASFIYTITDNIPIVAVAGLGHCDKTKSCRGIIASKDINNVDDLKGKTICFRRTGSGDDIFLRMYLKNNGIDPDKDVNLISANFDNMEEQIISSDACFVHYHYVKQFINSGERILLKSFDWINPENSLAVLVFDKEFAEKNRDLIERFISAYQKSIDAENNLTEEEKVKDTEFGLQIKDEFMGLSLPVIDEQPIIRTDLLHLTQDLLLEYHFIEKK